MKSLTEFTTIRAMTTRVADQDRLIDKWERRPRPTKRAFAELMSNCPRMYSWQRDIFGTLEGPGGGVYVAASPGGGKTTPYMCYWMQNMIGIDVLSQKSLNESTIDNYTEKIHQILFNPSGIKKLIIGVPTRTLANQTYEEIKLIFGNFYAEVLEHLVGSYFANRNVDQAKLAMQMEILNAYSGKLRGLMRGRNRLKTDYDNFMNSSQRSDSTEEENFRRRIASADELIVDEMQKAVERITLGNKMGDENRPYISRLTGEGAIGNPRESLVTVAIYENVAQIINKIDNVGLLVIDEAHLVQNDPEINDPRSGQIATALYKILKAVPRQAKFVFLSGTVNPGSAKNLTNYINTCFDRKIKLVEAPETARNQSEINVSAMDTLKDDRQLIKIISSNQKGNVIVLFSKKKMKQLSYEALKKISPASLTDVDSRTDNYKLGRSSTWSTYRDRDIRTQPKIDRKRILPGEKGAEKIRSELLRNCVRSGFGFIHRIKDADPQYKEKKNDNAIIVNLFKSGKIGTILATDAIGIGVNVTVKNMFIPSIEKFSDNQIKKVQPSHLAQLLHRTGRGQFIYGNIYTPQQYVDDVTAALTMTPREFQKTVLIVNMDKKMCYSIDAFINLWKSQVGRRR